MNTVLAYLFCFFSLIVICPVIGFVLLLTPGVVWLSRRFRFVSFCEALMATATTVYVGYLFCLWMDVRFSPWMFVVPGLMMVQNDIMRIRKAQRGGGIQVFVQSIQGEPTTETMVVSETRDEKIQALGDITGLVMGCLAVSLRMNSYF